MTPNVKARFIEAFKVKTPFGLSSLDIDDLLLLLSEIETSDEFILELCELAGGHHGAQRLILDFIDQIALYDEKNIRNIFGADTVDNKDEKALKARFARLSRAFHPDRGMHEADWLTQRMSSINNAHDLTVQYFKGLIEDPTLSDVAGFDSIDANPARSSRGRRRRRDFYEDEEGISENFYKAAFDFFNGKGFEDLKYVVIGVVSIVAALILFSIMKTNQAPDTEIASAFDDYQALLSKESDQENEFLSQTEINRVVDELLNDTSSSKIQASRSANDQQTAAAPINTDLLEWVRGQKEKDGEVGSTTQPASPGSLRATSVSTVETQPDREPGTPIEKPKKSVAATSMASESLGQNLNNEGSSFSALSSFIKKIERAYRDKDIDLLSSTFTANASYYDSVGRNQIIRERQNFFRNIDSPTADFSIHEFKAVDDVFFLVADIKSSFAVSQTRIKRCVPSVLVLTKQEESFKIVRWNKRGFNLSASECPS